VYVVRSQTRDALRTSLTAQGIQTGIHYPIPVHLQPAHADLGYTAGDFPVAEGVAREVLSLPIFPEMTREQVAIVAGAVSEVRV
jgi:dTDP-4-amino-4,6-dideoxygalactose transaminase